MDGTIDAGFPDRNVQMGRAQPAVIRPLPVREHPTLVHLVLGTGPICAKASTCR